MNEKFENVSTEMIEQTNIGEPSHEEKIFCLKLKQIWNKKTQVLYSMMTENDLIFHI